MFFVVNFSTRFSTLMINLHILDDSNAIREVQLLAGTPRIGHMTPSRVVKRFVDNSSQNRVIVVDELSLCLSCLGASNDMQYDLPGSFMRSCHLT